jgi:hypothetical protein
MYKHTARMLLFVSACLQLGLKGAQWPGASHVTFCNLILPVASPGLSPETEVWLLLYVDVMLW